MSKLLTIKLDVTKIPKERIHVGQKGKYIDLDIWINDEPDQYGNNVSANIRQTKEESESKERKIYVGNGQTKFGFDKGEKPAERKAASASRRPPADASLDVLPEDSCPF